MGRISAANSKIFLLPPTKNILLSYQNQNTRVQERHCEAFAELRDKIRRFPDTSVYPRYIQAHPGASVSGASSAFSFLLSVTKPCARHRYSHWYGKKKESVNNGYRNNKDLQSALIRNEQVTVWQEQDRWVASPYLVSLIVFLKSLVIGAL